MGRLSKYGSSFKAKVAMEAMKERESLSELAKRMYHRQKLHNGKKNLCKTHSKPLKSQQIIREN